MRNHVDLLSGKVRSVRLRSTATAKDPAAVIRGGFPDALVADSDRCAKLTGEVFRAFVKSMGLAPRRRLGQPQDHQRQGRAGQRRHMSDTLRRAHTNGRSGEPPKLAELAIDSAA